MRQHFFKWILISSLASSIAGIWIARYVMDAARDHGESVMKEYMADITTGICHNEGYDGGALIDFENPAESRCFTAKEGRAMGSPGPEQRK